MELKLPRFLPAKMEGISMINIFCLKKKKKNEYDKC